MVRLDDSVMMGAISKFASDYRLKVRDLGYGLNVASIREGHGSYRFIRAVVISEDAQFDEVAIELIGEAIPRNYPFEGHDIPVILNYCDPDFWMF